MFWIKVFPKTGTEPVVRTMSSRTEYGAKREAVSWLRALSAVVGEGWAEVYSEPPEAKGGPKPFFTRRA